MRRGSLAVLVEERLQHVVRRERDWIAGIERGLREVPEASHRRRLSLDAEALVRRDDRRAHREEAIAELLAALGGLALVAAFIGDREDRERGLLEVADAPPDRRALLDLAAVVRGDDVGRGVDSGRRACRRCSSGSRCGSARPCRSARSAPRSRLRWSPPPSCRRTAPVASRHASSSSWLRTPSLTWRRTVRWPAPQREPMLSIRSPSGRAGRSVAGTENTTGPMSCAVTDSTTPYERKRDVHREAAAARHRRGRDHVRLDPALDVAHDPPSDSPVAK